LTIAVIGLIVALIYRFRKKDKGIAHINKEIDKRNKNKRGFLGLFSGKKKHVEEKSSGSKEKMVFY